MPARTMLDRDEEELAGFAAAFRIRGLIFATFILANAGMAAGLVNTLRQVGTATGVAILGALYASRVTTATLHALAGLHAPPGTVHNNRLVAAGGFEPPTTRL
jgi:hypothetical protein